MDVNILKSGSSFRCWTSRHIGTLGEESLKHRKAIIFISVVTLLIDPTVTLSIGKTSIQGTGISVDPPRFYPSGCY